MGHRIMLKRIQQPDKTFYTFFVQILHPTNFAHFREYAPLWEIYHTQNKNIQFWFLTLTTRELYLPITCGGYASNGVGFNRHQLHGFSTLFHKSMRCICTQIKHKSYRQTLDNNKRETKNWNVDWNKPERKNMAHQWKSIDTDKNNKKSAFAQLTKNGVFWTPSNRKKTVPTWNDRNEKHRTIYISHAFDVLSRVSWHSIAISREYMCLHCEYPVCMLSS